MPDEKPLTTEEALKKLIKETDRVAGRAFKALQGAVPALREA
jgi:hypothetical protein